MLLKEVLTRENTTEDNCFWIYYKSFFCVVFFINIEYSREVNVGIAIRPCWLKGYFIDVSWVFLVIFSFVCVFGYFK